MNRTQAWVKFEGHKDNHATFVVAPLKRGMGTTIGNSLRRVLLSSLPGAAITSVKIDGVEHEYSTIPNIVEDVIDIIGNLKGVIFRSHSAEPKKLRLDFSGKGEIKAKNIKVDSEVEIINPDYHIATASSDVKIKIEIVLESGEGYLPSESLQKEGMDIHTIYVDASFSPIIRVNHEVESIRVGKELDYDQLVLNVWTNGTMSPENAVQRASKILVEQFNLFYELNNEPKMVSKEKSGDVKEQKKEAALNLSVDDLELSARSLNCLKKAGIATVKELLDKDLADLIKIKNFGKKSSQEINDKLSQFGLSLKGSELAEEILE